MENYKEYKYPDDYDYQILQYMEDFMNMPNKKLTFDEYKENKELFNDYYYRVVDDAKDSDLYEKEHLILNEADEVIDEAHNKINTIITKVHEIEINTNALKGVYYDKMQELIDELENKYIPDSVSIVENILKMDPSKQVNEYNSALTDFSKNFNLFPKDIKDICNTLCVNMNNYIRELENEIKPMYNKYYEKINAVESKFINKLEDKIRYCEDKKLEGRYVEYSEKLIRELKVKIEDLKGYRKTFSEIFNAVDVERIINNLRENVRSLQGVPGEIDGIPRKILNLFRDEGVLEEKIDLPIQFKIEPTTKPGSVKVEYLGKVGAIFSNKYYKAYTSNMLRYFETMYRELEELKNEI